MWRLRRSVRGYSPLCCRMSDEGTPNQVDVGSPEEKALNAFKNPAANNWV